MQYWKKQHGETTKPGKETQGSGTDSGMYAAIRASGMPGSWATKVNPTSKEEDKRWWAVVARPSCAFSMSVRTVDELSWVCQDRIKTQTFQGRIPSWRLKSGTNGCLVDQKEDRKCIWVWDWLYCDHFTSRVRLYCTRENSMHGARSTSCNIKD